MQTITMYGWETAFTLRATDTPMNKTCGPRDTIETLIEILQIFNVIITEENEFTRTPEFVAFLERHLGWLASMDDDMRLFDFRNKSHVTEVKSLLTYPHTPLQRCITYCDEMMEIEMMFRRVHDQVSTRVLHNLPSNEYQCFGKQFAAVNHRLAHILRSMPPTDYATMKENNRQLYYELNKCVMHPERIQNMADKFGIDFFDYIEAICDYE